MSKAPPFRRSGPPKPGIRRVVARLVAACFMVVATAADSALKMPTRELRRFTALDLNMDGFIDPQEATSDPELVRVFVSADRDRDGRLSFEEYVPVFIPERRPRSRPP